MRITFHVSRFTLLGCFVLFECLKEETMPDAIHAPFVVAAAQAAPVFLDRAATLEKACDLIAEAGRAGARLVVFPEAFIPTYPDWVWAIPPGEEGMLNDLYAELLDQAVTIPSDATDVLCRAA